MKVVLFCGGMGMRLRDDSQNTPKPLATIGYRPILWHVMSYYAHFGHTDFILCLGYRADAIKNYFLEYRETLSNDFVMSQGGREIRLLNRDIEDWTITFVDTGLHSNIGQRLKAVQQHIEGDDVFMANYSDGLSDLPLDRYREHFLAQDELDTEFIDGEEIDLNGILQQQLYLSLPVKQLCKESCLGLCSKCGKDLNKESCHCSQGSSSPFSSIKR